MENKKYTEISMDNYDKILSCLDSNVTEKELIQAHKKLIGKTCKNRYYEVKDCGVKFIEDFLFRDWGRSLVYVYSNGAEKFTQSKYLSDYFKSSIKELLESENISDEVKSAINSDKLFNDMSEEEIKAIYSSIQDFYKKASPRPVNIADYIMFYLYKLDGKGVTSFIKNNVNSRDLASHILCTCGLNDRASYYSGRGVNYSDLSGNNLVAIFNKLLKLDKNYAIEFVEMVKQMKTLGATEFINSFMNFAANGFKTENLQLDDSNISVDGLYDETRDTAAFVSILTAMSRGNDMNHQVYASNEMKNSFISRVAPILMTIDPEHMDKYNYTDGDFAIKYSNNMTHIMKIR